MKDKTYHLLTLTSLSYILKLLPLSPQIYAQILSFSLESVFLSQENENVLVVKKLWRDQVSLALYLFRLKIKILDLEVQTIDLVL